MMNMKRRLILGALASSVLATPSLLSSKTVRRVLIVGAGAAGLTAAFHLRRAGVEPLIVEAAPRWGGRVDRLKGFADFPLDLGAEWIHDDPSVLGRIVGRDNSDLGVETIEYRPQTYQIWHKGKLRNRNFLSAAYAEVKFLDTTWYGFFERFVLPEIRDRIKLNAEVAQISHSSQGISARLRDSTLVEADQVLVTVPLSVLKRGGIRFDPLLPDQHLDWVSRIAFGQGFKVFLKFRERFYPDILMDRPVSQLIGAGWDEKTYYDAAFGKLSQDNVLGLFTVASGELPRAQLSDAALVRDVLAELDGIYEGAASRTLVDARVRNWSQAAHIHGSYSMGVQGGGDPASILTPVGGRVHFAGEALGGNAQATVHGAAFSAIRAVQKMLSG